MSEQATILVVEDEKHIRLFLHDLLTFDGHTVTAVANGEEALPYVHAKNFDLALLDIKLGQGMSGIDLLQALREQTAETTVIILTAYGSLETAVDALRLGAHDYLLKPCPAATLRQKVQQGLQKYRQARQREQALAQLEQTLARTLADIRTVIVPPDDSSLTTDQQFLRQDDLIIDQVRHTATFHGHLLDLSPMQFDLLYYLLQAAPRIVPPQELVNKVCQYELDEWEASKIIRPHIYRLRQKIQAATGLESPIHTVRGVGYTLV